MNKYNINLNEMYKRALLGGKFSIWEWHLKDNRMFILRGFTELLEFTSLYECIKIFVLPEDLESATNDLDFFINGNTSIYRSEVRIKEEGGKIKWVLIQGEATRDDNGNIVFVSGTIYDIGIKKILENEIRVLSYYDSLTGLPNRNLFMIDLKTALKESYKNGKRGALVFLGIDDFKSVNDTFGHLYGDMLLKILSQLFYVFNYEIKAYRLGGDEFAIIMDKIDYEGVVKDYCDKIMEYCADKPFELMDKSIYISLSIGIAFFPIDATDADDIYRYADLAMHQSKLNGKSRITLFEKTLADSHSRKKIIEQELKNAINNNELFIVYQPQADILNRRVIGFEALLRWKNDKLGNVSPGEFIPIAEKSGSIIEIGEWVIKSVVQKIKELSRSGYDFECISVNISPVQLKRCSFFYKLIEIIAENEIPPNMLELEITEGTLIDMHKNSIDMFERIIEKGIRMAIDDFGTGYSSLNYLTMLPINTLKIDKSFIDNIDKDKNMVVIECILNLSKAMKYKIIAEGVETQLQMDMLLKAGSNIIQGYYFSKPISENELELMLSNNQRSKLGGKNNCAKAN